VSVHLNTPIFRGVAASLLLIQLLGRWWLQHRASSGHIGALVLGAGFVPLSVFLGVSGALCGAIAFTRMERHRLFGIVVMVATVFELRLLSTFF
jgi:hypothetical protein